MKTTQHKLQLVDHLPYTRLPVWQDADGLEYVKHAEIKAVQYYDYMIVSLFAKLGKACLIDNVKCYPKDKFLETVAFCEAARPKPDWRQKMLERQPSKKAATGVIGRRDENGNITPLWGAWQRRVELVEKKLKGVQDEQG